MSDFLTTLAARTLGAAQVVAPRRAARFESGKAGAPFDELPDLQQIVDAPLASRPAAAALPPEAPMPDRPHAFAATTAESADRAQASSSLEPAALDRGANFASNQAAANTNPAREPVPRAASASREVSATAIRPTSLSRERPSAFTSASRPEPEISRRPEAAPAIHVTIGRVEVRAIHSRADSAPAARTAPEPSRLSLGSYLRGRRA